MYQIGDRVVYGIHGVCVIADLEVKTVDHKQVTYLVLEPLGQLGSRYLVPTHNQAAMAKVKPMLTREALESLLDSEVVRQDVWIRDEGQRKQTYRELISSADRQRLMSMVHTLYRHQAEQKAAGKKVHLCDENFLRDAEKLLTSEVSIVLKMEPEESKKYVRTKLSR